MNHHHSIDIEEFQRFAYEAKLTPASQNLYLWLVKNHNDDADDLREFDDFIEKHRGKPYHRETLRRSINQLKEHGLIVVAKEFRWNILRLALRPLKLLNQKKSPKSGQKLTKERSKPRGFGGGFIQQQPIKSKKSQQSKESKKDLAKRLEICEAAGLCYVPGQQEWLLAFDLDEIANAVKYLLSQINIHNREGFFRKSLEECWNFIPAQKLVNIPGLRSLGVLG